MPIPRFQATKKYNALSVFIGEPLGCALYIDLNATQLF
jgi:hypothetical protein